jgi:hypothetical protein
MSDLLLLTILVHTASTLAMCGVIWFVQLVHYPLFDRVAGAAFSRYERAHTYRTSYVVVPLMLGELGSSALLVLLLPGRVLPWVGLGLLAAVWLSTFLVQVPAHRRLERGFDGATHRRLVRTNWWRTVAWTARGAIATSLLASAIRGSM